MSKEAVHAFLDRAPISLETKDYIMKHLHVVPNPAAHLDMLITSPQVGLCVMLGKTVGLRWDASISLIISFIGPKSCHGILLGNKFHVYVVAGVFHSTGLPRVADQAGAPRRESSAHAGAPAHWQDGRFAA